jgi:3-oxoacyl-(acyl-carrier-protein) synthase
MQDYVRQRDLGVAPLASLSTSMTCSSAFHSLLIARSFLLSDMAKVCLFGGAEACLTSYSVAQMEALKIYAREVQSWPCQPFGSERVSLSSVVLGEGAGSALLLSGDEQSRAEDLVLLGVGWAVEPIPSATGISTDGLAFKAAMSMALREARAHGVSKVDAVIAHAPGTQKGDAAELAAISSVFGADTGVLSTKHLTGHTYGASGMVSLSLASALLNGVEIRGFPYPCVASCASRGNPGAVAINTAGFGGNAISIIVGKGPNGLVGP